jgi:hypothetical protein
MNTSARVLSAAVACFGLVAAFVAHAGGAARSQEAQDAKSLRSDSRVRVGFDISPVELNLRGKNRALVGLGSYLVNAAGGCNDCHTSPPFAEGGNPFEGEPEIINAAQYLAGGRQFGPITSSNITPDENGRPAGLTFEEFEHLIRTGRDDDDPDRILQVMPWNIYAKMTRTDLRAVYEYLRAIPSLPDNTPTPTPPSP